MKLVENAQHAWKWLSVQMMALAGALQAAWAAFPDELRGDMPGWVPKAVAWITFVLLFLGVGGRLIHQPSAVPPIDDKPGDPHER
jgi:hypothetical protein